ncbi:MAG: hypothetical protein IBX41_00880 [Methanophagales archaeon]|nr:hypothetical protein [Methanophagales archaeon]
MQWNINGEAVPNLRVVKAVQKKEPELSYIIEPVLEEWGEEESLARNSKRCPATHHIRLLYIAISSY